MTRLGSGVAAISVGLLVAALSTASRAGYAGLPAGRLAEPEGQTLALLPRRVSETDLEVHGLAGGPKFVSRSSLLALPQTEALLKRSEDLTEVPKDGVRVAGVGFEVLLSALDAGQSGRMGTVAVEAVCSDGYSPAFPPEYIRQHHPILVLTIEGLSPAAWAEKTHTADLGPYFVTYASFAPAFHVLSHEDRQQVPIQLVRLDLAAPETMFAGITPPGAGKRAANLAAESPVTQGYRIAQQNCFRCHSAARYGGTVSGRAWPYLSGIAKSRPERFAAWVHDPQSLDAKSKMPPNPNYDRDTLTALTKYFAAWN